MLLSLKSSSLSYDSSVLGCSYLSSVASTLTPASALACFLTAMAPLPESFLTFKLPVSELLRSLLATSALAVKLLLLAFLVKSTSFSCYV